MSELGSADVLVFLDRDDTIIKDRHLLSASDGVALLPGVADGLRRMLALGGRLVIVMKASSTRSRDNPQG